MIETPKISVIVPVYNRERSIETCIQSLFEQTLDKIEYIIVNDASTDHTLSKLDEIRTDYPSRKLWTKIISLEKNSGVAVARRTGIEQATGEYIIHCDSDDWVEQDLYEQLYNKAKECDADIVGCDIRHEYPDKQFNLCQQYADTIEGNIQNLLNGVIFPSLCTSLTRRSLITENNISFPKDLNIGEDLLFNIQLYIRAKKIIGIPYAAYHYTHTEVSVSEQKKTMKSVNICIEVGNRLYSIMKDANMDKKYETEIAFRRFTLKFNLIRDFLSKEDYDIWINLIPETHKYIWKFYLYDRKLRFMLWLAAHHMFYTARTINQLLEWQHNFKRKHIKCLST